MYHHTEGIFLCERLFGTTITVDKEGSHPREVPVRLIAELHVMQDLGWIPSPADYIRDMPIAQWMGGAVKTERSLSDLFVDKKDPPPAPLVVDPNLIIDLPDFHG